MAAHLPLLPSGRQATISYRDQEATAVEAGGGLRTYTVAGRDVLDGYGPDQMCSSARGQPLIPWPNRLADGEYAFGGTTHHLAWTEPEQRNAIHGLVRFANWSVAEQGPEHVEMAHRLYPQPGYPFLVDLRIVYRLDAGGLTTTLTATNRGTTACPFGAGAHPYLRLGFGGIDDLSLECRAEVWLPSDERGLPTGGRPSPCAPATEASRSRCGWTTRFPS